MATQFRIERGMHSVCDIDALQEIDDGRLPSHC